MDDKDVREIYTRLGSIEQKLAGLIGMLGEREKACNTRHENMDAACAAAQEIRGAWKVLVAIAAVVGAAAGQVASFFLGRH